MSISVMHKPAILIGTGSNVPMPNDPETYKYLTDGFSSFVVPSDIGTIDNLRRNAFCSLNTLKTLDFNNVENITSGCCYADRNLESVIAHKAYRIGSNAFGENIKLSNFDASKILFVGDNAFSACRKLSNIDFLSNALALGGWLFSSCSSLTSATVSPFTEFSGGAIFRSCYNLETAELKGYYYPSRDYVFYSCINLKTVTLNGIMYGLGREVFCGCFNLSSIINDFYIVHGLSSSAFGACHALTSLFIPFVSSISENAFKNCHGLKEITASPSYIRLGAFSSCSSLESIYLLICSVPNISNPLSVFAGTPIVDSSYLGYFGSIFVPSSWVASYKAATNWALISDRITSLPASFDSRFVYAYEFYKRSDLTDIPSDKKDAEYICRVAFSGCSNITNVEMSNVKMIDGDAFFGCSRISSFSFPNCHYIEQAFYGTSNLQQLYAPNLTIAWNIFGGITGISSMVAPNLKYASLGAQKTISVFDFSEAIYFSCSASRATTLNVPKAKRVAFASHLMSSIYLPEAQIVWQLTGSNLQYADLPKAVVLNGTFNSCYSLVSVYMPEVKEINNLTFRNCKLLSEIDVDGVYYIGSSVFEGCIGISKISLKKAESLGSNAFFGCSNLRKILTRNLINLSTDSPSQIFANCNSLESVYLLKNNVCVLYHTNIFDNTPMVNSEYLGHYGSIYVPASLVSLYQTNSSWSHFRDRFVGLTDQEIDDVINNW